MMGKHPSNPRHPGDSKNHPCRWQMRHHHLDTIPCRHIRQWGGRRPGQKGDQWRNSGHSHPQDAASAERSGETPRRRTTTSGATKYWKCECVVVQPGGYRLPAPNPSPSKPPVWGGDFQDLPRIPLPVATSPRDDGGGETMSAVSCAWGSYTQTLKAFTCVAKLRNVLPCFHEHDFKEICLGWCCHNFPNIFQS